MIPMRIWCYIKAWVKCSVSYRESAAAVCSGAYCMVLQRGIKVDYNTLGGEETDLCDLRSIGVDFDQNGTFIQRFQRFQIGIVIHKHGVEHGKTCQGLQIHNLVIGAVDTDQGTCLTESGERCYLVVGEIQLEDVLQCGKGGDILHLIIGKIQEVQLCTRGNVGNIFDGIVA